MLDATLLPILTLAALLLAMFCIGSRVLALFRVELDRIEELLAGIALGGASLICLGIFLGTFHLLYKEAYALVAITAVALSLKQAKRFLYIIASSIKDARQALKPTLPGLLLLAYIFFILVNTITAFSPIADSDALTYHLAFAKTYANSHQLVYQPWQVYTTMPQGMTMLYVISELFSIPKLSSLIAYSFAVFASLAVFSIARRLYSRTTALIASLLFFTAPAVIERLRQTMVDLSLTFFFLLGVIMLIRYADERDEARKTRLVMLMAIFAGTAATIKLTGILSGAALFSGLALHWLFNRQRINMATARQTLLFGLIALLLVSPWLVRSYAYTGNPVYPQAQGLFGGKYLDSSLPQFYSGYHKLVGLERNLPNLLLVHWNITFNSRAFDAVVGLTPFFLMALPLIFLVHRQVRNMQMWITLFIMSTVILTAEFWVHPVIRYMLPGIALLSICSAIILETAMKQSRLLKATIILLLMASLSFNAAMWLGINEKNIQYFASGGNEAEYYAHLKNYNLQEAISWINGNTAQDSVILIFNDQRGYFLDRKYIVSSPYQNFIDYGKMTSPDDLLKRLIQLGVTHIMINDKAVRFANYSHSLQGSEHVQQLMEGLVGQHGELMHQGNQVRVYRLQAANSKNF